MHVLFVRKVSRACLVQNPRAQVSVSVILGTKIAKDYGKKVLKDEVIYTLLPSNGRNYLEPDFRDVIDEYLSFEPGSEKREEFVESRQALTTAIYRVRLWCHLKF